MARLVKRENYAPPRFLRPRDNGKVFIVAKHTITLIPGDGIGIETSAAMQRVVEAAGADIEWEVAEAGAAVMEKTGGSPLPESTIEAVKRNKVAIKGPITTPVGTGFRSVNVALRKFCS